MRSSAAGAPVLAILGLGLAACGPEPVGLGDGDSSSETSTAESATAVTSATSTTSTGSTSSTSADGTGITVTSDVDTGDQCGGFYGNWCVDFGDGPSECDVFAQDCPAGEKCMPWGNGGWSATKCSPIYPDPAAPGEPCVVEGSGTSGIDSCELGAMCWNVDVNTNLGTCISLCTGDADDPVCPDALVCSISNQGALAVCLSVCDPVLGDCAGNETCAPTAMDGFPQPGDGAQLVCFPDASGGAGAYGDPCEFLNVCDPGLFCADAALVPGCQGLQCCSEFCDVTDAAGDMQCSGYADGQICLMWWSEGQVPPGLEHVGGCAIPP